MKNTPFKMKGFGTSPIRQTGVPHKKTHYLSEDYVKTYDTGPVKGPEESDVMDIITKRKQSGPKESPKNQQKEIDNLTEKRDPNKKTIETVTPKSRNQAPDIPVKEVPDIPELSLKDQAINKGKEILSDIYNELTRPRTPDELENRKIKRKNRVKNRNKTYLESIGRLPWQN